MLIPPQVLITDTVHPLLISGLERAGYHCEYHPDIQLSMVLEIIKNYKGIIINSKIKVDRFFLDQATQLQFIARLGSGLEIIDLVYAKEKNILVHRSPDGNCDAVAEHAIGMLLALANNLCRADRQVRSKNWQREANRGWELMGKTVGIIGFGHTGQALAKKLAGFEMNIMAYDKYKAGFGTATVEEVTLKKLLEEADIISLHIPLTPETKGWFNTVFFKQLVHPIILINTARGAIIDTKSLVEALEQRIILGACLDVFENEKPTDYTTTEEKNFQKLFMQENVILSPHVAGWTKESKKRLSKRLLERILSNAALI